MGDRRVHGQHVGRRKRRGICCFRTRRGVQFGDFHFGPPIMSVPRPQNPLLLAWPVNNYWNTNFAQVQPGRLHLRYGFLSLPAAERDQFARHAVAFRQPPLVWPITTGGRDAGNGVLPGSKGAPRASI